MEKTMQNPKLIPVPFANSGIKDDIPKVKSTSMSDEKASWETGFPEATMLPVYAGGLPPDGKDFNGVLNQISENLVFQSKGGRYKFDPDFAISIGGYPKGATLQTNDESAEYQSLIDNNLVNFNTATPEEIAQAWRITGLGDAIEVLNGKFDKASVKNELGLSQTEVVSQKVVTELGSGVVGSFENGLNFIEELTSSDQQVTLENEFGKQPYYWDGDLPKQVPAGSTPQSTGGIGKGAWVGVGDASLRGDLNRESGAGLSGFSHDALYAPATVGHKLKNSVWVTDAPFNAKMDGVTDDTEAFQKAIDYGMIVQIPNGDTVVSNLTIYPNTTIIGCGRRHGIHVTSGTQILYKGTVNTDWLTLADRDGMVGDGQGGVTLKSFTCINASSYLELPSSSSEPYYLYRPNAQKVLDGNSRGLFAVESTHVDWGSNTDWRAAKEGGVNCPFLIIDDVKLQNFTYPLDVHTWMCQLSNFEPYLCGPVRISGTSSHITNSWPRKPLSVAWQVGCSYSNMTAASLGEDIYLETANGGLECYFGFVSLDDVGYELIRGTVINAYKGTVKVNGLSGVTGSTNRPGRLGKISGSDGFIIWGNIPKMQNRNGEQISLAFNLFTAISESLLSNHIFESTSLAKNSWVTNPWERKLGNSSDSEYFAPYVSQLDTAIIGSPYIIYPTKENKLREVGCLNVGYKNSVLIRGAGKIHRFRIYGGFDDGVTSAASTNPRQKHGMLRIDFTHYASPLADGVSSASDNFKTAYAVLTFSRTLEGRVYDMVLSDSVSTGVDKPIFFRVNQEIDGGLTVEFGVTRHYDGNDDYRQCLLDIKYSGSYPRNADNNTISLNLQS